MLGTSNDSISSKKRTRTREHAPSSNAQHKVKDYMANTSLESPAKRDFKQVERQHSHERYQRLIYAALATTALIAFLGSVAGFYFGYFALGIAMLCTTGGISAFNQWLTNTIPDVKIHSQQCEPKPCNPTPECPNKAPKVIFHGVAYPIKHQCEEAPGAGDPHPALTLSKPTL